MRRLMTALAVAALLGGAGCKPPPKEQAIEMFKKDVQRYFNDQNREALDRKERLRGELDRSKRNPLMDPATGTLYSLFSFDPAGFVVDGLKCQTCGETIQKMDGDFLVVRNAILRVDLRRRCATAKCPRCKSWVEVMLRYGP